MFVLACPPPPSSADIAFVAAQIVLFLVVPMAGLAAIDLVSRATRVHAGWHAVALLGGTAAAWGTAPSRTDNVTLDLVDRVWVLCSQVSSACLLAAGGLAVARGLQPGGPAPWSRPRLAAAAGAILVVGPVLTAFARRANEAPHLVPLLCAGVALWAAPWLARGGPERQDRGSGAAMGLALAAAWWMLVAATVQWATPSLPLDRRLGEALGVVVATAIALGMAGGSRGRLGHVALGLAPHALLGAWVSTSALRVGLVRHPVEVAGVPIPVAVDLTGRPARFASSRRYHQHCYAVIDRRGHRSTIPEMVGGEEICGPPWALDPALDRWPEVDGDIVLYRPEPVLGGRIVEAHDHRTYVDQPVVETSVRIGPAGDGRRVAVLVVHRSVNPPELLRTEHHEVALGPALHALLDDIAWDPPRRRGPWWGPLVFRLRTGYPQTLTPRGGQALRVEVAQGTLVQDVVSICASVISVAPETGSCQPELPPPPVGRWALVQ